MWWETLVHSGAISAKQLVAEVDVVVDDRGAFGEEVAVHCAKQGAAGPTPVPSASRPG